MIKIEDHSKTALIYGGENISYRELINRINCLNTLIDILPGDRVAIISENRPEWVYAFFATLKRAGIVVPIDFMSSPEEILYILKDATPKMVFYSDTTKDALFKAIEEGDIKIDAVNFDNFLYPKPTEKSINVSKYDTALILYTSGTTGKPKGVMLTYKNILSNIYGIDDFKVATKEDRTLAILPFHHAYPLVTSMIYPLYIGATIVFLDKLTPEDIMEKLKKYRITILIGVPRLYRLFHRKIFEEINKNPVAKTIFRILRPIPSKKIKRLVFKKVHDAFGGNIKYFVSGGAKLDLEIAKDLSDLGFTIIEGYGLTETSPIATINPPNRIKLGSVGIPIRDVRVRISEEGEVLLRGTNVMKGYYKKEKETAEVIKNGWLYTGDLGYMDNEGYLYITGRKKDIIVLSSGKNINPEEIETELLKASSLIKEVGIVEQNDTLHAIIYPDFEKLRELGVVNIHEYIKWEVIDRFNRKLPEWKRIQGITIVNRELPKTRLGKLKRFMLKEFAETSVSKPKKTEEKILESPAGKKLKEFLEKLTGKEVYPEDHIEVDLGLDSLGKVELQTFIEKTFGVEIKEEELAKYMTVASLLNLIETKKIKEEPTSVNWKEILKDAEIPPLKDYPFIFWLGRKILKLFFILYNRAEIVIPPDVKLPDKPFILAPNHASYIDSFVLSALLPEEIAKDTFFLGEETYFSNPFTSTFGKLAHVITVNVQKGIRESLQKASWVLRLGKIIVIFPEGARTRDGQLLPFKKGFAILSKELNVPIVPVAICGTFEVMSVKHKIPRPKKIKIVLGHPVYPDSKGYDEITEKVREDVKRLIDDCKI